MRLGNSGRTYEPGKALAVDLRRAIVDEVVKRGANINMATGYFPRAIANVAENINILFYCYAVFIFSFTWYSISSYVRTTFEACKFTRPISKFTYENNQLRRRELITLTLFRTREIRPAQLKIAVYFTLFVHS